MLAARGSIYALLAVLAALALPGAADAATNWVVTNAGDGASVCPSASQCTLRGAIGMALAGDTVTVPAGSYSVSAGVISIPHGIHIVGPAGAGATTVSTAAAQGIFTVSSADGDVTIEGLTITGADTAFGGAVRITSSSVRLLGDVLSGNQTSPGLQSSGAVQVFGSNPTALTVSGSTFKNNRAGSDGTSSAGSGQGDGGAIDFHAPGILAISDSTFDGNRAGGNGSSGGSSGEGGGGALAVDQSTGTLAATIARSTFTNNRAGGDGGTGGSGGNGSGGALEAAGSGTSLGVSDSTFSGNRAGGNGGAADDTAQGEGGALFLVNHATVNVTRSLFAGNQAGGSAGAGFASGQGAGGAVNVGPNGSASLVDDTLAGNIAPAAGAGEGGSIRAFAPTTLVNDTIVGGTAAQGGNIEAVGTAPTMQNTIVAGGSAPTGPNCVGTVSSSGHNIEDGNSCGLVGAGDRSNTNPLLVALASNGGPTQTLALAPGSPAIDGADPHACPATDQRGVLRPAGAGCDVGAFEVATPSAQTGGADSIGLSSAHVGGSASNPDLAAGSASFDYGRTSAYGASTPRQAVGATSPPTAVSASLAGLAPGTVYHYRLVVANPTGTAFGADRTFTTSGLPTPSLSRLGLKPKAFAPDPGRGTSTRAARRQKRKTGATVSYVDSQAAVATFTVQRPIRGFRSGRRCVAKRPHGRSGRRARRCSLFKSLGSFTHADRAGANRFHFTGRARSKPLARGRYRLLATARSATGQKSRPLTASFRIVR